MGSTAEKNYPEVEAKLFRRDLKMVQVHKMVVKVMVAVVMVVVLVLVM